MFSIVVSMMRPMASRRSRFALRGRVDYIIIGRVSKGGVQTYESILRRGGESVDFSVLNVSEISLMRLRENSHLNRSGRSTGKGNSWTRS
jgi:hypothetical protein